MNASCLALSAIYCQYEYLPYQKNPIPPMVGSAIGNLFRVTEVRLVVQKMDFPFDRFALHWRLTLGYRRDPILLLTGK